MQPTMVLALQKMVEVEVDNLARLCGLVVSLQLDLDHIPRTRIRCSWVIIRLVFEDIRQSVSTVVLCLFLLILWVVHHNFSSHVTFCAFSYPKKIT